MKRPELLKARIALYRRYLREGADGDMARTYLWLIRCDEIELTAIAESHKDEAHSEPDTAVQAIAAQLARSEKPKARKTEG
jgi:hypothetical protein